MNARHVSGSNRTNAKRDDNLTGAVKEMRCALWFLCPLSVVCFSTTDSEHENMKIMCFVLV